MKRKRHTPQEIIAKLREAEVDLNQGDDRSGLAGGAPLARDRIWVPDPLILEGSGFRANFKRKSNEHAPPSTGLLFDS